MNCIAVTRGQFHHTFAVMRDIGKSNQAYSELLSLQVIINIQTLSRYIMEKQDFVTRITG